MKYSYKLTKEQAALQVTVPMGKRHIVHGLIEHMQVGQMLYIPREDFTWKTHSINHFVRKVTKRTGRKFTLLKEADKKGWVVKRDE